MSISIVTRKQAEDYAKENNINLLKAKDILKEAGNHRIQPARYYHLKFDQDGFCVGTEKLKFIDRIRSWKFYIRLRYWPKKKPKRDDSFIGLDEWIAMSPEQRDKVTSLNRQ